MVGEQLGATPGRERGSYSIEKWGSKEGRILEGEWEF